MGAVQAFDLGPISVGPTPLAILIVGARGGPRAAPRPARLQPGRRQAGRQAVAGEPAADAVARCCGVSPAGYVKKTFPGLDPVIARDLTQYISTKKVPAGVDAGRGRRPADPVHAVEVRRRPGRWWGGAQGRRLDRRRQHHQPHRRTRRRCARRRRARSSRWMPRTTSPALALGMSDDDDDYVVNVLGSYFDADDAPPASPVRGGAAATATMAPPAPVAAMPAAACRRRGQRRRTGSPPSCPAFGLPAGDGDHPRRLPRARRSSSSSRCPAGCTCAPPTAGRVGSPSNGLVRR